MRLKDAWEPNTSAPTTIVGMDKMKEMMDTYFRGIDVDSFGIYIGGDMGPATEWLPFGHKLRRKYEVYNYTIGSEQEDWQFEINIPDGDAFFREIAIQLREYAKRQYDDKKIRSLIYTFCKDSELCCEAW